MGLVELQLPSVPALEKGWVFIVLALEKVAKGWDSCPPLVLELVELPCPSPGDSGQGLGGVPVSLWHPHVWLSHCQLPSSL